MKVSEVLDAAADWIEHNGWYQGNGGQSDLGGDCVSNTIDHRICGSTGYEVCMAFANYLGLESLYDLFRWNDAEHRTKEQVVKELRACAADLRDSE